MNGGSTSVRCRALIADDEVSICNILQTELQQAGFEVQVAHDGGEALKLCRQNRFDAVVMDMRMPVYNGIQCIHRLKRENSDLIAVIMTAYASVEQAVEAMKTGADDYIAKPFDAETLIEKLRTLLHTKAYLPKKSSGGTEEKLLGRSQEIRAVNALISRVKDLNSTVLITGESGTGKGVVARELHRRSIRAEAPFIHVSCPSLPATLLESELFGYEKGAFTGAITQRKGKFEQAGQGTIFLDEIGTLPIELQSRLLNVLQERDIYRVGGSQQIHIRARVLAATNENLEKAVAEGRFRQDLYYRLNVVNIECPPLRTHKEDLQDLVPFFLQKHAEENHRYPYTVTADAMKAIMDYEWPGNIRELENTLESIAALADGSEIGLSNLPGKLRGSPLSGLKYFEQDPELSLREQEILAIVAALERNGGQRTSAAKELQISRRTLQYKIKQYNL